MVRHGSIAMRELRFELPDDASNWRSVVNAGGIGLHKKWEVAHHRVDAGSRTAIVFDAPQRIESGQELRVDFVRKS